MNESAPKRRLSDLSPHPVARLRRVAVTPGVFWVEAPEADLRVLCGCPADVVKHLMRRGLIADVDRDGVAFETGPNAILLSDTALQHGNFCNLAEFPVLQMLYRQGMLLPGHPNNHGDKPILIGIREQLDTQLKYIHRGNYGLISKEEMIAVGTPPEQAEEMMALKLRFAFGRIVPPNELIDARVLGDLPVMIRGGVRVRRTALNQFEFTLGDESVAVDLNLGPGEGFLAPYTLGRYTVDREYFSIVHTGDGDGWDPNRPCTGSLVMFQGRVYLVDAGPSLQQTLMALGIGINEIDGLFHTHCHDDHFAGLTALLHADRRIKYFATPLVRASVTKKFTALLGAEEDMFDHCFEAHDLVLDQWNNIEGLDVKPVFSPHPVENTAFLFRAAWAGGYRCYAHMCDIVSLDLLERMVAKDGKPGISRGTYHKVATDYLTPAHVKKLDIGGGLIHGTVNDFTDDGSDKILLTHTARQLTVAEMEVGAGAPLGAIDVVIPGDNHFAWSNAFQGLRTVFPDTPHHELRMLLNSPLAIYNPETLLLREGQKVTDIFLVVTGTVGMFRTGAPINGQLSAGALIGDAASVRDGIAQKTYRAASFVQALRVNADLFRQFVERNGLRDKILEIDERREFLRSTWICAEAMTQTNLNLLARNMRKRSYDAGDLIDTTGALSFVVEGRAEQSVEGRTVKLLNPGDFFGQEQEVLETKLAMRVRALEPTTIFITDPVTMHNVPVMRWRLLENYRRRVYDMAAE